MASSRDPFHDKLTKLQSAHYDLVNHLHFERQQQQQEYQRDAMMQEQQMHSLMQIKQQLEKRRYELKKRVETSRSMAIEFQKHYIELKKRVQKVQESHRHSSSGGREQQQQQLSQVQSKNHHHQKQQKETTEQSLEMDSQVLSTSVAPRQTPSDMASLVFTAAQPTQQRQQQRKAQQESQPVAKKARRSEDHQFKIPQIPAPSQRSPGRPTLSAGRSTSTSTNPEQSSIVFTGPLQTTASAHANETQLANRTPGAQSMDFASTSIQVTEAESSGLSPATSSPSPSQSSSSSSSSFSPESTLIDLDDSQPGTFLFTGEQRTAITAASSSHLHTSEQALTAALKPEVQKSSNEHSGGEITVDDDDDDDDGIQQGEEGEDEEEAEESPQF